MQFLKEIGGGSIGKETPDCGVTLIQGTKKSMVSSLDFFYPSIDNPELQGRIACCNVLSDLYAMGVTQIDQVLMVLGISRNMNENEQEIVTRMMVKGFDDTALEANTSVIGGQTVYNPWPMIGGAAIASIDSSDIVMPYNLQEGDVMVLTKPLGVQLAVNAYQWMNKNDKNYSLIKSTISADQIKYAFKQSIQSMATLNLYASILMKKHKSNGATDVTGFGILGHANYLAQVQKKELDIRITHLPIIKDIYRIEGVGRNFRFFEGLSAETSGGLLIGFREEDAKAFIDELAEKGQKSWIIGKVEIGNRQAYLQDNIQIIDVDLNQQ